MQMKNNWIAYRYLILVLVKKLSQINFIATP